LRTSLHSGTSQIPAIFIGIVAVSSNIQIRLQQPRFFKILHVVSIFIIIIIIIIIIIYFHQFESENQLLDFLYFNRFVYLAVMCFMFSREVFCHRHLNLKFIILINFKSY